MGSSDDILRHFGVKGMHWGVRRSRLTAPESPDATRVRTIQEKVRKGGTRALTNEEIQALVTRMNLEQQYGRLNPGKAQRGAQIAADILRIGSTVNQVVAFAKSPAGKAVAAALKRR